MDAQLPPLLAVILSDHGFDAIHTNTLDLGNETPDHAIAVLCAAQNRTLVAKYLDFYHAKILHGKPEKLLLVKVGNCKTRELLDLFRRNLPQIEQILTDASLVEMYYDEFVVLY